MGRPRYSRTTPVPELSCPEAQSIEQAQNLYTSQALRKERAALLCLLSGCTMIHRVSPLALGLVTAAGAFFVDQGTKAIMVANAASLRDGVPVFPGFNLVFFRNDGVSFGLLSGVPWWSLVVMALIICAWMMSLMLRSQNRIEALAYGLVIGGALGNVLDRVRHGAVTDFLDLYVGSIHWPAFNLADALLVSGFAIIFLFPATKARRSSAD